MCVCRCACAHRRVRAGTVCTAQVSGWSGPLSTAGSPRREWRVLLAASDSVTVLQGSCPRWKWSWLSTVGLSRAGGGDWPASRWRCRELGGRVVCGGGAGDCPRRTRARTAVPSQASSGFELAYADSGGALCLQPVVAQRGGGPIQPAALYHQTPGSGGPKTPAPSATYVPALGSMNSTQEPGFTTEEFQEFLLV